MQEAKGGGARGGRWRIMTPYSKTEAAADAAGARVKKKTKHGKEKKKKTKQRDHQDDDITTKHKRSTQEKKKKKSSAPTPHRRRAAARGARTSRGPGARTSGGRREEQGGGRAAATRHVHTGPGRACPRDGAVPGRLAAKNRRLGARPPRPKRLGKRTTVAARTRRQGAEAQRPAWGGAAGSRRGDGRPTTRGTPHRAERRLLRRGGGARSRRGVTAPHGPCRHPPPAAHRHGPATDAGASKAHPQLPGGAPPPRTT